MPVPTLRASTSNGVSYCKEWNERQFRLLTFVNAPEVAGNSFAHVADYDFEFGEAAGALLAELTNIAAETDSNTPFATKPTMWFDNITAN
jgi:hypothetical protein